MIPQKTIEELIAKHSILEKDLSSGSIDKKKFAEKSKEYSDLSEIIESAKKYVSFEKDKNGLEKILNEHNSDIELKKMAEIELDNLREEHKTIEKKLNYFNSRQAVRKTLLLKLNGTGGLKLVFCCNLFEMWKISAKSGSRINFHSKRCWV